jgi:LPS export ABC transporter permease LptG
MPSKLPTVSAALRSGAVSAALPATILTARLLAVKVISRYFVARFLRAFAGSFALLALVILVIDMLLDLSEILEAEQDALGVVGVLLLRFSAFYLPFLVPLAAFTGAFFALGTAARAHEVLALKAGGISPLRAVLPVFAVAVGISALALALDEGVSVRASAELRQRTDETTGGISLRSGTIWYHTGRFVYNIGRTDADGETLRDVRIFERDDAGRLVRLIQAESARQLPDSDLWSFEDVSVRRFDPARPDAPPELEQAERAELELSEARSSRLLQAEIAALPLRELVRHARESRDPRLVSTLHQRLSGPVLVVVFVLLAVPLALRAEQTRTLALPALQGVLVLFLLLSAREYGASFALQQGPVPAMWAPWLVLALFAGWGAWRLARAER